MKLVRPLTVGAAAGLLLHLMVLPIQSQTSVANPVQPADSVPAKNQKPDVVYVTTPQKIVDAMLDMASIQKGDVLFDLGSGDGRIPISAAQQHGIHAIGYEIDPELVKLSQASAKKKGVEKLATFEQRDIFKLDLSQANIVTLYLLPSLNEKLIPQLDKMKAGSRIVSHDFDIEGVLPIKTVRLKVPDDNGKVRDHMLYLFTVPLKKIQPPAGRPGK